MAILYGTTAEGESLPVEVNEFGQLIAQGLTGQPGSPGAEGPPGPPGVGELPPDPYEGAILGWENGALAWVGIPVPLPPGTFGPITAYSDGVISVDDLPTLVQGQSVFLSDTSGNRYTYTPTSPPVFRVAKPSYFFSSSDGLSDFQVGDIVGPTIVNGNVKALLVESGANDVAEAFNQAMDVSPFRFTTPVSGSQTWSFETLQGASVVMQLINEGPQTVSLYGEEKRSGVWERFSQVDLSPGQDSNPSFTLSPSSTEFRFIWQVSGGLSDASVYFGSCRINGGGWVLLTSVAPEVIEVSVGNKYLSIAGADFTVGDVITAAPKSGDGIVQSVTGGDITLSSTNDQWKLGQYVTAPAQKVAARYLSDGAFLPFV